MVAQAEPNPGVRRNYLITGASSQIGQEVCAKALGAGNNVTALYSTASKATFGSLYQYNGFRAIKTDFSVENSTEIFLQEHNELVAKTDIFIGLAARREPLKYGLISSSNLLDHFRVNLIPNVVLIQMISRHMQKRRWGRILVASSIGVKFGGGLETYCYSISKYANELIPSFSRELARDGVLYNVLRIGFTRTIGHAGARQEDFSRRERLIPMERAAEPHEIAEYIYWLTSESNTYITGQVLAISGGE